MTKRNDGGPAFPTWFMVEVGDEGGFKRGHTPGMPMRDYIAVEVLAQLASHTVFPQSAEDQLHAAGVKTEDFEAYASHVAYGFADAMLKERGK